MRIQGYAPRVYEGVRTFFREHPVVEIKMLRGADFTSDPARILGGTCERCGWEWYPTKLFVETLAEKTRALGEELPAGTLPEDFWDAIFINHAWDQQSRSHYCGGRLKLALGT